MKNILDSITSILDGLMAIGVNQTNGANQSILQLKKRVVNLDKACDYAEKINRIVTKNMSKFTKREQIVLDKYIERFNKLD